MIQFDSEGNVKPRKNIQDVNRGVDTCETRSATLEDIKIVIEHALNYYEADSEGCLWCRHSWLCSLYHEIYSRMENSRYN